jgi:hypothetical protein
MKHDSKVKRFPGHIILPEYLNIGQVRLFEKSLGDPDEKDSENKSVWKGVTIEKRLPVVLDIVTEWHLEGVPEKPTIETFPASPVSEANDLVSWIYMLIRDLWVGEQVPNA